MDHLILNGKICDSGKGKLPERDRTEADSLALFRLIDD